jgi:hypothetical protein
LIDLFEFFSQIMIQENKIKEENKIKGERESRKA